MDVHGSMHLIERASHCSSLAGDDRFKQQIDLNNGIRPAQAAGGRPNKQVEYGYEIIPPAPFYQ
jgi:hypothetical protein